MAAAAPRRQCRLFRTYGARGGGRPRGQPGGAAVQWFSPPGRKRSFSSGCSSGEPSSLSVASDDPDDPDFPGSPAGRPRRRRPGGRSSRSGRTPTVTPRRPRLRARPPRRCSTPCDPRRPPPRPSLRPGRRSRDLSVCSRPRDADELGTSASLFSTPASPGGPPSPDAVSTIPGASRPSAASPDAASLRWSPEAAPEEGAFTRMARRAGASFRSVLFGPLDPGSPEGAGPGPLAREAWDGGRRSGNAPGAPSLSSAGERVTDPDRSDQSLLSREPVRRDRGQDGADNGRLELGASSWPQRPRPGRKRKHQEARESPAPHHRSKKQGRDARSPRRPAGAQTSSWTKTRASFSFHKKKIVTEAAEVCSACALAGASPASPLPRCSASPIRNGVHSALSPWNSSSLYLLSPLKTLHVTDQKTSDARKVFRECNQEGPIPFSYCFTAEKLQQCQKVGEGVFGEVFRIISDNRPVALKIIAIEGPDLVNGAHQKTFEEILPEIIISKELSLLSDEEYNRTQGFIGLNAVHCVQGSYPPLLLEAWDLYSTSQGSANDRPDFFEKKQLFIVLEFEFGGVDLEQMKTRLSSVATAKSILHQVTASLAVAEASLRFEHRDLHWGNVLIKKTDLRELHYTLNGKTYAIATRGLQVNIIDYTLSRLERDGIVVFCDISMEEDLFTGKGDYQFEIYRLMRKENKNCWGEYHPYNNVLWLHYLIDKILTEMNFKSKCQTASMKRVKRELKNFHKTVLNFDSATDLLCQHSLFQ